MKSSHLVTGKKTPMSEYESRYDNSWALVIGINKYLYSSQLLNAKNDAEKVAQVLKEKFNFPKENIVILLDEEATKERIWKEYTKLSATNANNRVLFFFAGHGFRIKGSEGHVGFLVPYDGDTSESDTLLRWDNFVYGLDLIPAKHIFFVVDSCFSGLFITRNSSGGNRLVEKLLQEKSYQFLTSGKSDEEVSDGGGPRDGHSVFTGHFLDALEKDDIAIIDGQSIKTASTVSSYVFSNVGGGIHSRQVPSSGHIKGGLEGEFIFNPPELSDGHGENPNDNKRSDEGSKGKDALLIDLPPEPGVQNQTIAPEEKSIKERLEDILQVDNNRILLDRFINPFLQKFLPLMNEDRYPNTQQEVSTSEKIASRIRQYEIDSEELLKISMVLSKWGKGEELRELEKILTKVAESEKRSNGLTLLVNLQWYPLLLLTYAVVISSLATKNSDALRTLLQSKIKDAENGKEVCILTLAVTHISSMQEWFKNISGHERHYAPKSEYLFQFFQPITEDLLFIGDKYEKFFDEAEIFIALAYIHETRHHWGPVGRFGWKHKRHWGVSPYTEVVENMKRKNHFWSKISTEVFYGDDAEFTQLIREYSERLDSLNWF